MRPAERVREHLMTRGIGYECEHHPLAYTTQEVAAMERVSGWQFAKPVILMADGQLAMVVLAAPQQVDLDKAKVALEAEQVRLATEDEFAATFADCDVGAEPPFGALYGIPLYMDEHLTADAIVFKGGSHQETMKVALKDYISAANPTIVDIARAA